MASSPVWTLLIQTDHITVNNFFVSIFVDTIHPEHSAPVRNLISFGEIHNHAAHLTTILSEQDIHHALRRIILKKHPVRRHAIQPLDMKLTTVPDLTITKPRICDDEILVVLDQLVAAGKLTHMSGIITHMAVGLSQSPVSFS
jgi:hypothetical protein